MERFVQTEKNKDDSSLLKMLCFIMFHYHPKLFRIFVIKHGKSLCVLFFHFGNEQISLFLNFAPMQGVPVVRTQHKIVSNFKRGRFRSITFSLCILEPLQVMFQRWTSKNLRQKVSKCAKMLEIRENLGVFL